MCVYITMYTLLLIALLCVGAASEEVRMALVLSGDITDLGYNYQMNAARVKLEGLLNITTTHLFPNVNNETGAMETFERLANEGYNFIVSAANEHGNAALNTSYKYPSVYFAAKGSKPSPQPNLAYLGQDALDTKYVMGYYAGLMTANGKVGLVVPGPPADKNSTINTFYLGAKRSNPNCTVYVIKTGTWYDPDLASGAANKLLEEGLDVIGQYQDDTTVMEIAMNSGLLGVADTGFPESQLYGQQVGFSIIQDLTPLLFPLTKSIIDDVWVPNNYVKGSFYNGIRALDNMSFKVPQAVRIGLQNEVQKIIDDQHYYLCSPLLDELDRANKSSNCITYSEMLVSLPLSNIVDLGYYTIPLIQTKMSSAEANAFIALASIAAAIALFCAVVVVAWRNATIIRSSSPTFGLTFCIGAMMISVSVILWIVTPDSSICSSRVWLLSLGYVLLVGSLLVKNVRVWLIFDNRSYKSVNLPDWKLSLGLLALIAVHVVLLGVWNAVGDTSAVDSVDIDGIGKYNYMTVCKTKPEGDNVLYAILAAHLVPLAFGCYLSYKLKLVDIQDYNEMHSVASILYCIFLCTFIAVPAVVASQTTLLRITVICSCMLLSTAISVVVLFLPKILDIINKGLRMKNGSKKSYTTDHSGTEMAVASRATSSKY